MGTVKGRPSVWRQPARLEVPPGGTVRWELAPLAKAERIARVEGIGLAEVVVEGGAVVAVPGSRGHHPQAMAALLAPGAECEPVELLAELGRVTTGAGRERTWLEERATAPALLEIGPDAWSAANRSAFGRGDPETAAVTVERYAERRPGSATTLMVIGTRPDGQA